MFRVITRQMATTEPYRKLPGTNAVAYTRGMALVLTAGKLAKAGPTVKPTHIAVADVAAATPASEVPVFAIQPDMEFETESSATVAETLVGSKVTLGADGASVTATTTDGVFTITHTDGAKAVRGRFV